MAGGRGEETSARLLSYVSPLSRPVAQTPRPYRLPSPTI